MARSFIQIRLSMMTIIQPRNSQEWRGINSSSPTQPGACNHTHQIHLQGGSDVASRQEPVTTASISPRDIYNMKHLHTFSQHLNENLNTEMDVFCKKHNISNKQFKGEVKIDGSLDLWTLKEIPQGFNPTVGGNLDLVSLKEIPQGFNPIVGGNLDLWNLNEIPQSFNPTVSGNLDLRSLKAIPQGFNPSVSGSLDLGSLKTIPQGFNPTIRGNLNLESLETIPQGFNPTVSGNLYLGSLKVIPQGFNPTVGLGLNLVSLETIPNGTKFDKTEGKIWVKYNSEVVDLDTIAGSAEWVEIT
jgi:hypothetical protein